jgi:gliding motility-associated-like protein
MMRVKLILFLAVLSAGITACSKKESPVPIPNDLYVPTAFTPDGDGVNDSFVVKGAVLDFHLEIFSPSNVVVFVTDDQQSGWNGKYKGDFMPPDHYLWVIDYTNLRNEKHKITGYVELVR